ncbi:MAG: sigma-70 family RNA polymerase sigma factor [Clostridia bacterium]|nr:sigma-70 family RNA polymerase sigma factor [Clostridia bacterium]
MLSFLLSLADTPEDKQKVEALYYKYRTLMKYIAMKMLHNEDMAEDAVGDALVSLIENLDRIDEVDSVDTKSFIYIVIRNASLNRFNKSIRHKTENIEDFIEYQIDDTDAFEDVYLNDYFRCLTKLAPIYRDVMELKTYYDMSTKDIASVLHISENLVRKRIERARKLLRELAERGEIIV